MTGFSGVEVIALGVIGFITVLVTLRQFIKLFSGGYDSEKVLSTMIVPPLLVGGIVILGVFSKLIYLHIDGDILFSDHWGTLGTAFLFAGLLLLKGAVSPAIAGYTAGYAVHHYFQTGGFEIWGFMQWAGGFLVELLFPSGSEWVVLIYAGVVLLHGVLVAGVVLTD